MRTAQPPAPLSPGDLVSGKYRIEREIARGGMGVVMAARHESLGTSVAVKFLLPEAAEAAEAVERFEREARAVARLRSRHVARVFDVDKLPSGAPFLVMELLEGHDLGQELDKNGALPIETAVGYVIQAIDALEEAHEIGIIHRDLKPENLFLSTAERTPTIKVLDFGISKIMTAPSAAAITSTNAILGSPGYMSPEQVRSARSVDARTDIWALGVILRELVTDRLAYPDEAVGEVIAKILTEDLPPVRDSVSDFPVALDAVIGRCLERDREKRFASVVELRDALLPFASARVRASMGQLDDSPEELQGRSAPSSRRRDGEAPRVQRLLASAVTLGEAPNATVSPTAVSWAPPSRRAASGQRLRLVAALAAATALGAAGAWWSLACRGSARFSTAVASSAGPDAGPREAPSAPIELPPQGESPAPAATPRAP